MMQLENSVSSEDIRSLAINSNVDGLLSRPHNSDLVGQSNTQNSVLMGHTNTLMVDSSECLGSHPLLPNLIVCTDNTCNINMSNTLQQTLPLGAMMSDTIKNKIWANEYVDLGILLPNGDVKSQVFPIVVNGVGNEKKLALQENSKQIKTLDQWISAFSVYMTIYCQKISKATGDLIKYMDIIRNMARQKGNWLLYDMEFRKSKCQLNVSWGNMHHQLWLQHMLSDRAESGSTTNNLYHGTCTQTQNSNNMPRVPIGYCVRFHLGNFCQLPCQYNHKCFVCNSPHSSIKCWHLGESGNQSGTRFNNGAHLFCPSTGQQFRFRNSQSGPRFNKPYTRYPNPNQYVRR
jgi:hypothetical protein